MINKIIDKLFGKKCFYGCKRQRELWLVNKYEKTEDSYKIFAGEEICDSCFEVFKEHSKNTGLKYIAARY